MPLRSWLIFLSVVLSLLILIHGTIALHLWLLLPDGSARGLLLLAFTVLGTAYIVGRLLEDHHPPWSLPFLHVGSWWLGIMSYLFLGCLLLDALLLLHHFLPFLPGDLITAGRWYFSVLGVVILITMILGHLNVLHPAIKRLSLQAAIPLISPMRLVVASDLHLCALVPPSRLERIVQKIRSLQPDVVLFPGDIVDEDLSRSPRGEVFRLIFQQLKPRYGILAVTGNHEWISGVEPAVAWLQSCGIEVLRDRAVDLGPCRIAGREDAAGPRFGAGAGVPLEDVLSATDRGKPLIVLDHQPVRLREAVASGAHLVLCGHTHHGQFWPFHWLTRRIFEVSFGHKKIEQTDVYVSCGAGAWGPQVRTSSRSEIVLIEWA